MLHVAGRWDSGEVLDIDQNTFREDREIEEEHSAIRTIMQWIEADLARQAKSLDGIQGDGPLLGPLRSFREHLSKHFQFEERSGVLPAALMFLPDSARRLEEWRSEHVKLLMQLDGCLRALELSAKTGIHVRTSFEEDLGSFFTDLRRHDVFENRLLGKERSRTFRSAQSEFGHNP